MRDSLDWVLSIIGVIIVLTIGVPWILAAIATMQ